MYTKGEPTGLKKAFLDYMLSEEVQGQLVEKMGYIPITKMQVERDAQGNVTKK
jgi:phosphate transport system substrate-binding protein